VLSTSHFRADATTTRTASRSTVTLALRSGESPAAAAPQPKGRKQVASSPRFAQRGEVEARRAEGEGQWRRRPSSTDDLRRVTEGNRSHAERRAPHPSPSPRFAGRGGPSRPTVGSLGARRDPGLFHGRARVRGLRVVAALALVMALLSGCRAGLVKAHQRELLADRIMRLDGQPQERAADEHVLANREGAIGGTGTAGGGCGCN
jgi:hypothetical protein